MFKDFSDFNSLKLLIWFISFLLLSWPNHLIVGFLYQFFLYHFFIEQSHFYVTWVCYLHKFSIHIPNYLLWLLTFYCSYFLGYLFSSLFQQILFQARFIEIAPFFTLYKKYLHILVYLCILVKCSFLIHELA